ncbi:MAG: sugar ABC transporter permease [Anaerolineae bacterium]|nr:sugar ABC transporter permease [Anaerolineae bacterium]
MALAGPPSVLETRHRAPRIRHETVIFYLCIAPWLIGLIAFIAGPMVASAGLSFTRWDMLSPPEWVGLRNYVTMFTEDPDYWQSLRVTVVYSVFSVPLRLSAALFLAILLNEATKGVGIFRTIFYLPSIVASVAAAVLWSWILNPRFGPVNGALRLIGIRGPAWFSDPGYALWGLVLMSGWGVGGEMLIFLAGLKGIPSTLYEAAEIDGAGRWPRFIRVTLPMLSPAIFFNFVMSMIGSFQTFDTAYVISTARAGTIGGPLRSTLFYMLHLYRNAFSWLKMGYASALAWVLFLIILGLTLIALRSSALWVYYEAERGR